MPGKVRKSRQNKLVAKLVTEKGQPCVFCQQDEDDEVIYGKLYSLGDIQCHYFCVLLSCCLVQKGRDTQGLFGFLYKDIIAEVERSKKHKCSYCGHGGANLGCSARHCRKQFHLPCGRRKNAVSLFYGNYKSFCEVHAPKQKISDDVMAKARVRLKRDKMLKTRKKATVVKDAEQKSGEEREETVCLVCYEEVQGYPTSQTLWPPCCGRDAWLHRSCLQRMALSAGMHYLKCPLCNDKDQFHEAVSEQGYYIPDRDAAWELEKNAFAEMYERPTSCEAVDCRCPFGRDHDEPGIWDVKLCLLCGSCGLHAGCAGPARVVCATCRPAAPRDIAALENRLEDMVREEQARVTRNARRWPLIPSRMTLRRTKSRAARSGTSSSEVVGTKDSTKVPEQKSEKGRELNLECPRKSSGFLEPDTLKDLDEELLSPIKLLEQSCLENGGLDMNLYSNEVIEKLRTRFNKPQPLCEKKRIVNEIVEDLRGKVFNEKPKSEIPLKVWNSPKKCFDVTELGHEHSKGNVNNIQTVCAKATVTENVHKDAVNVMETDLNVNLNSSEENLSNENDNRDDENDVVMINDLTDVNNISNDDESSTSTFKLPVEFIADSDDSLPIFDTPKKQKTIDIEDSSSLEIYEHDETFNVVKASGEKNEFIKNITLKGPTNSQRCSFKFSPTDKETLQTCNVDVDAETFKDKYLSEVDPKFKYNFKDTTNETKLRTAIGFAVDATDEKMKLKFKEGGKWERKDKSKRKVSLFNDDLDSKETNRLKTLRKKARELKLKKKDVHLKFKWKGEKKDKVRKRKQKFKQYVLMYSPTQTNKVIEKPDVDVTPMKRKYIKLEKTPDNLIQTSILNFFKLK